MSRASRLIGLIVVLATAVAATGGIIAWREMGRVMQTPLSISSPQLFTIDPGTNMSQVARNIEAEGWITHHGLFVLRARLDGIASLIQAGTYEIAPEDTPALILSRFRAGDTKNFAVTFIEGSRFADMRRVLAAQPHLEHTIDSKSDLKILAELGVAKRSLEGMFFPSTYEYSVGSTDRSVLERAHERLCQILDEAWDSRAADLPYASAYEALIMASIIEKETGQAEERRSIGGVLVRRLKKGMKLQTDPTVIYGLGDAFDGNLKRVDLTRDTPYNTYTRAGLPPTPIAMPGEAAIAAATDPAAGKALYFVAKGDGTHQFSETLQQHNAAVRRYQLRK